MCLVFWRPKNCKLFKTGFKVQVFENDTIIVSCWKRWCRAYVLRVQCTFLYKVTSPTIACIIQCLFLWIHVNRDHFDNFVISSVGNSDIKTHFRLNIKKYALCTSPSNICFISVSLKWYVSKGFELYLWHKCILNIFIFTRGLCGWELW